MWSVEASSVSSAAPNILWNLWTRVSEWSAWDPEVVWSKLEGGFSEGTPGVLKPKGGPPVKFVLTRVEEGRAFSDSASLPLARMRFHHELAPAAGGGTKVTHRVEISGPLGPVFGWLIGRGIRKGLPHAVARLARLAEQSGGPSPGGV